MNTSENTASIAKPLGDPIDEFNAKKRPENLVATIIIS
jgi:hypothetical protein